MIETRPCEHHPQESIIGTCNRCGDFGCRQCLPNGKTCRRCVPNWNGDKPDLQVGMKWVFQDPNWVTKVLIGAGCIITSFFLIPIFILMGYHLEIARREHEAPQALLPEWTDIGRLLWDGLKFWFSMVLFMLSLELAIGLVFGVIILGIVLLGNAGGGAGAVVGAIGLMGVMIIVIPLFLLIAYAVPAIQLEYLRTGSVFCGFHVGNIWRTISQRPGDYFFLFIGAFVTRFIANVVGQLLCLIGIFATAPWAMYTEGWLIGRYWAWLDGVESQG